MEPTQETINNAKQLHSLSWISPELKSALENDFPELKENEDEKIREDLIGGLMWQLDNLDRLGKHDDSLILPGFCHTVGEHLAYLERQKEQKPESCDCSRDEESYTNGIHHVLMNPEAYGLIKQKPEEQLGGTFTSYDMAKTFTEGQNYVIAHPEKFGLCKPAEWSEEEKKHLYNAIEAVKCVYDVSEGTGGFKCVEFLKSLRPQSSGNFAISFMNYLDEHRPDGKMCLSNGECADIETAFKKEDWAKIIRYVNKYQPHWKPSKEQMDHLAYAYTQLKLQKCYAPHVYESLGSLYDDLKKLI